MLQRNSLYSIATLYNNRSPFQLKTNQTRQFFCNTIKLTFFCNKKKTFGSMCHNYDDIYVSVMKIKKKMRVGIISQPF